MRTTILITFLLLLAGCGSKPPAPSASSTAEQEKGGLKKGFGGGNDNSPIVIADGDSIHFHHQKADHWVYKDGQNITAQKPEHRAFGWQVMICPNGIWGNGNQCSAPTSGTSSGTFQSNNWTLSLCSTGPANACNGNAVVTVTPDSTDKAGIDITNTTSPSPFTGELASTDGPGLVLPPSSTPGPTNKEHFYFWYLTDGGASSFGQCYPATTPPNPPAGNGRCVLKIDYCSVDSNAKKACS